MKISVVLPAYNEVDNVGELTIRLSNSLQKLNIDHEILYVIQGKDGAYEKLISMKNKFPQLRLIYFPEAIGVGPAFITGFKNISRDITHVLTMDADLNHQPEEFPLFLKAWKKFNTDLIIGSRKIKGGKMENTPPLKNLISSFTNILFKYIFGLPVNDITSGYRLYKREVIDKIVNKLSSKNFEFYPEVIIWAKKLGFSMIEVPITFKYRIYGESKLNFFTSGIGYIKLLYLRLFK
ncbi:MAG: glycosyltransferase [Candidatus Hodarchaeota archaeon]